MRALCLSMGLLASSLAAAQPLPDGRPKVLVLEIEASQGVTKATAEVSTALLLGKLRQLPSIHVMAYRDVEGAMTCLLYTSDAADE